MSTLADSDLQRYGTEGYLAPLRVLPDASVAEMRAQTERLGAARAGHLPPALNMKAHLLIPWLWDLVHDPRVVDPVKSILGPDVLCWGSSFFDKRGGTPDYVPWHQDSTYWGLEAPDALTAWVAFTPSHAGNGCLRVIPGSHGDQRPHVGIPDSANMLVLGGEALAQDVPEETAVDVVLQPGEMSLHHLRLIHGSKPNTGSERRTGFAIRYIAGYLRGSTDLRGYATLVSGRDLGGFLLEEKPEGAMHRDAIRRHARILRRSHEIIQGQIQRDRSVPDGVRQS